MSSFLSSGGILARHQPSTCCFILAYLQNPDTYFTTSRFASSPIRFASSDSIPPTNVRYSRNPVRYSNDDTKYENTPKARASSDTTNLNKRPARSVDNNRSSSKIYDDLPSTRYPKAHSAKEVDIPDPLQNLKSRPPNIVYDTLSATNSHLLNIALADFLPPVCHPEYFRAQNLELLETDEQNPSPLPIGHHLVYFPAQVKSTQLLEDGTDVLHWPGQPFTRRLWAGGSLEFKDNSVIQLINDTATNGAEDKQQNKTHDGMLKLNDKRAVCIERIVEASSKGEFPNEKIVVDIERLYGQQIMMEAMQRGLDTQSFASIIEKRRLVFMRPNQGQPKTGDEKKVSSILSSSLDPDFSVRLTPDPSLLFRFSALTHNAHLIHLDPHYTYHHEGYEKPLVHGPLTLVLMLSILRSRLKPGMRLKSFSYRNLVPLFVNEELIVNVKLKSNRFDESSVENEEMSYTAWIEKGGSGALAVRGTAVFEHPEPIKDQS